MGDHGRLPGRRRRAALAAAVTAVATGLLGCGTAGAGPAAAGGVTPAAIAGAAVTTLPHYAEVVTATKLAADYYRRTYPVTTVRRNGWSWATYYEGALMLLRTAGDQRYRTDLITWAKGTSGALAAEIDPDSVKAGQTYLDLTKLDPAVSPGAMDARLAADLTKPAAGFYYWSDALFMGLPNWPRWAVRTGDSRYLTQMTALYAWARDDGRTAALGCTAKTPGLYDPAERLWYRDCRFIGTRDANGAKVFWARGNAWVLAAMADVIRAMSAGDARAATYLTMYRAMADRVRALQGSDGFWRSSLLDTAAFPAAETSSTALFTYALAYGVRTGLLDRATYLPVVARAWSGLARTALRPGGFLTGCQTVGDRPGAPYAGAGPTTPPTATSPGSVNVESPPYCVGAFLMAGSEVAALLPAPSTGKPVTATAQQTGNEAPRAVDGDVTTRWSASGFPQTLTVDLGASAPRSEAMVVPYLDRAYRYRVQVSADKITWRTVVDRTANVATGSHPDLFSSGPVAARYARLTVTAVAGGSTSWVSILEFAVR